MPVSEVSTGPLILVAKNDLGVKSVKELVELAKKKPGTLKFGAGGGTGSSLGLATALLQTLADINITIVPYRGAGPALNDLLGGHIDAMIDAMPVMSVQAKEGKVTPLAVTGTKRASTLPDVPTMQEIGYKEFVVTGWYGILAPPGTPPAIVQQLRDEAAKAVCAAGGGQDLSTARAWSRAARSPPTSRNTWPRSTRSTPRSSRTRTSSRSRFRAPSRHARLCRHHACLERMAQAVTN